MEEKIKCVVCGEEAEVYNTCMTPFCEKHLIGFYLCRIENNQID